MSKEEELVCMDGGEGRVGVVGWNGGNVSMEMENFILVKARICKGQKRVSQFCAKN